MQYRQLDGNIGELKFYGNISEWWINGEDFDRTIEEMAGKFKEIQIRAHCYGGSVFEGNVMCNTLTRCKPKKIVHVDGVAASMFTIVMQYADEIIGAENAFFMVHCPTGLREGNAKQMFEAAKLMTSMEKNFVKVLMRRTGKTESEIMELFDGNDHWFSAEEALEYGLITGISEPVASNVIQLTKPTENGESESVFGRYAALLNKDNDQEFKNPKTGMKKELIAQFNLTGVTENSTDAEIQAAIKAKFDEQSNASVEAIVAGAEKANGKQFEAKYREGLVNIGKAMGVAQLQVILGAESVVVTDPNAISSQALVPEIKSLLDQSGKNSVASDRKSWGWEDWQKNDSKALAAMEKTDNATFKALYKAEFGEDLRDY